MRSHENDQVIYDYCCILTIARYEREIAVCRCNRYQCLKFDLLCQSHNVASNSFIASNLHVVQPPYLLYIQRSFVFIMQIVVYALHLEDAWPFEFHK